MRKLAFVRSVSVLLVIFTLSFACTSKIPEMKSLSAQQNPELQLLQKLVASEKKSLESGHKPERFIAIFSPQEFLEAEMALRKNGATILFREEKSGYLHFESLASDALKVLEHQVPQSLLVDRPTRYEHFKIAKEDLPGVPKSNGNRGRVTPPVPKDTYSIHMTKSDALVESFKSEYGVELDGSSTTIAVFDTGLDITRTDVFQDRIVGLRSLRDRDVAYMTKATESVIDGKTYFTGSIDGIALRILRTPRLQDADRDYYIGYFSEKQFSNYNGYANYDFNQDKKDSGIYTVIAFRDVEGEFVAYINVNDTATYGEERGDRSIEDENKLMDFNWVAKHYEGEKRFVVNEKNPMKSYYRYTTRMDLLNASGALTKDRNKGVMNLAINMERGRELTEDGSAFKLVRKEESGQEIYKIGIVGFDINGHGTFCAAIAAGNNALAPELNPATTKAKIVGVSFLGGGSRDGDFFDEMLRTIANYSNVVFSFSFGSSFEINDVQSSGAKIYDALARTHSAAVIKAAGNDGPSFKSMGTEVSEAMISVANYLGSNSKRIHSGGNFEENKYFISPSSSRGPTMDGALKPDIGAPGWVLAAMPLSAHLGEGETRHSYQYWPGTSMATPNVASVVALLYDAATKAGMRKADALPAVSLDKIHLALKNAALPYDSVVYIEKKGDVVSDYQVMKREISWPEGGAGRVNALGAWEVLKKIADEEQVNFYVTTTASKIADYPRAESRGYFNIDKIDNSIDFSVSFAYSKENSFLDTDDLAKHERFILKIPSDIDWLSFDLLREQKERYIDVFASEQTAIKLFVRTEKLLEHGRLKGGIHHAVVKGFNLRHQEFFDFAFPVTVLGYDTKFDPILDKSHLERQGFIPSGDFVRYFLPLWKKDNALLLDLDVSGATPGMVAMELYRFGHALPEGKIERLSRWAIGSSEFGDGRSHLRYIVSDLPAGLYEVVLTADENSPYTFSGASGSYFNFRASEFALEVGEMSVRSDGTSTSITLRDCRNAGSYLRMAHAEVNFAGAKLNRTVRVHDQESVEVPIHVPNGFDEIIINTSYLGGEEKMDIDLTLTSDDSSIELATSGGPTATEEIRSKIAPGEYRLKILGYAITNASKEADFTLSIKQRMKTGVSISKSFKILQRLGEGETRTLGYNYRWPSGHIYDLESSFVKTLVNLPEKLLTGAYTPIIEVDIGALYGTTMQEQVSLFRREL
ncbi:MAG: S8 family serine peptidase [Oligoflexia bacterium]|nr:S8 family serine peptidase [Oligoflexia bacterium]MBF0366834.1 S8 family serine peptidase [Oligoflexia bacterium]